jgi:hypothetical protein
VGATCAEHVLQLFETERPADARPRRAIDQAQAWARGEIPMSESRGRRPRQRGRQGENAGRLECRWQRSQLPESIRALVLDDQRLRNAICWSVFDC